MFFVRGHVLPENTAVGEGNGQPPQGSCLESPMHRGSPAGCGPWGHRVRPALETKPSTTTSSTEAEGQPGWEEVDRVYAAVSLVSFCSVLVNSHAHWDPTPVACCAADPAFPWPELLGGPSPQPPASGPEQRYPEQVIG